MSRYSFAEIEHHIAGMLQDLGATDEAVEKTPRRFTAALEQMLSGYQSQPAEILARSFEADYDEMVIVRDVPFWSLCEHHLLPFAGKATVGYLPKGRVVGLSKIPRLVRCLSRRLQMQERLTVEIASNLQQALEPRGVGVLLRATHLCMVVRGAESTGEMVTSSLQGCFRESEPRAEFLRLADGR